MHLNFRDFEFNDRSDRLNINRSIQRGVGQLDRVQSQPTYKGPEIPCLRIIRK